MFIPRRAAAAVGAAALILCTAGDVGLAAAKHPKKPKPSVPKAGTSWFSKKPNVSISVLRPAKKVSVFISCFTIGVTGESWEGNLPLKKGSFSLNKVTKVSKNSGTKFGTAKAHVLLTGKFETNKFVGVMQISGSTCAEHSYTAKFNKGGGSGK